MAAVSSSRHTSAVKGSAYEETLSPEEYPLYIQTVQGQTIRTLIEAIELILPEENFTFTKDGIQMIAVDTTQSLVVHLKLLAQRFEVYHCEKPISVGVSIMNLLKIMKIVGNVHTLTMFMKSNDYEHLFIRIENPDKNIRDLFSLNLLDITPRNFSIPDETFTSIITMPSIDFQKFMRDMSHIGDYVEIISAGDSLRMRVKGEFAEQEKIFGESHGCMNFLKTDSKDIVHGEYNLRFLVMFSRCTNLCNNIEMCLKNNFPLIIRYQVANLGEIKLAVIGRVKDSDEL
jgi:proliferating cell nuclear antigen